LGITKLQTLLAPLADEFNICSMLSLNHKVYGQGPALIVLHGLFGSLDNWATLARQWGEQYSVYLVDQRNHGRSPHHDEWNYKVMAEDLFEFMDSHQIYQAHLLGHSMGGKTVMKFADLYPERIDKLIVADMAPKAYPPHHTEILKALTSLDLRQVGSRSDAQKMLSAGIPEAGVQQFLLKSLHRKENREFGWRFNLDVIHQNYPEVLAEVSLFQPFEQPTLFLYGEKSHYVKPTDFEMIREMFPQALFEGIPNAGHWLHAEAPSIFSKHLLNFLSA